MDYIKELDILDDMPWLAQNRKKHIASTAYCARELALLYAPHLADKAFIAGLYHDCAKGIEDELLQKYNIGLFAEFKSTAHAPLGALLARDMFSIDDNDVLDAICWHCTGKELMSVLDKIIFLADAIEPLRNYPNVEHIRKCSKISLDAGVLAYLENLISYLNESNSKINPYTMQFYNNLKTEV